MKKVAIVGATGVAGQQFVVALSEHPWFQISGLAASERSAGKKYREALTDSKTGALGWYCDEAPPTEILDMDVQNAIELEPSEYDLIFTAVESDAAKMLEPKYAEVRPVVSTASAFRYEGDVPILVPGVNSDHARLIDVQRRRRGWKGFITPIPNCTTTGLVITLKPLYESFGLRRVLMTSMQAVSGAGRNPGVIALDVLDNIIPFIPKEEDKVQKETLKILGRYKDEGIRPAGFSVSCTCTRVNVKDGHTESVFASLERGVEIEEVKNVIRRYSTCLADSNLPSAPKEMIILHEDPFRPQPRVDRYAYDGMATSIGRIRRDNALENGIKYVLVSHNTRMGAAKGAVLVAELLVREGFV